MFAVQISDSSEKMISVQKNNSRSELFFWFRIIFWFRLFFRFNLGSRSWLRPTHRRGPSGDPEIVQKGKKPCTRLHFGAKSGVISGTQGIFFDPNAGHAAPNEKRILIQNPIWVIFRFRIIFCVQLFLVHFRLASDQFRKLNRKNIWFEMEVLNEIIFYDFGSGQLKNNIPERPVIPCQFPL